MVSLLSLVILVKFIILFFLPGFMHFTFDVIKKMISIAASFTIFESVWGLLQFILRGNLGRYIESYNNAYTYGKVAWENSNLLRASGTFVDPDLFGTFMFMHFVLFFYLLLTSEHSRKFEKTLYGLCAILSGASVFITGNRALYICFVLSFVGILIMTKKARYIISFIKKPIGLLIIVVLVSVLFPYVSTRMQNLFAIFSEGSGTFRVQIAEYAARLGFFNLFGVGLATSPYHFALEFPGAQVIFGPDYPHNLFFQVFAETGILGLVAFLGFLYFAFRPLSVGRRNTTYIYFYFATIAFLISACFYPLFVPLVELPSFFFLYLGIAAFSNI
jgi:O-antigen ligase